VVLPVGFEDRILRRLRRLEMTFTLQSIAVYTHKLAMLKADLSSSRR
jgi:hypothetical protein